MLSTPITYGLKVFYRLWPPQKPLVYSGCESVLKLADMLIASGKKRPLLVTGKYLLKSGKLKPLIEKLHENNCEVSIYNGSIPNPTFNQIKEGLELSISNKCDSIIAIGGGSVIDVAKVISVASTNKRSVEKLVGILKIKEHPLPFYAAPTTSGSGSETTIAAVISDARTHKKHFFIDPKLIPIAVALDPQLIKSLPSHMTAAVGMDALTHAIEAYISANSSQETDQHAEMAIKLIFDYLPLAVSNGEDLKAREMMAQASFQAGYAFTKSSLGYVHAISHQISACYNTPHGLANAILLPRVLRFNKSKCLSKYARLEMLLNGTSDVKNNEELADNFIERIDKLYKTIEIPAKLDGLDKKDFTKISKDALIEAKKSYAVPKTMKSKDIELILHSITRGKLNISFE